MPPVTAGNPRCWVRGPGFDLLLVVAVPLLALSAGLFVQAYPASFFLVLDANLWLLGYHHVVSTFTRLAFDRESFDEHRFLIFGLPPLIVVGVVTLWQLLGFWAVTALYLYWQWFHYTRQSYGVARMYAGRAGDLLAEHAAWDKALLYAVPVWGILYRSHQYEGRTLFLQMKVRFLPVPEILVWVSGVVAAALTLRWLVTRLMAWRAGRLAVVPETYMLSHLIIFTVGYVLLPDLDDGWMVVNVWHNAQYVLVVWLFNANRFKAGEHPQHRFLSWLSQPTPLRVVAYFGLCLVLTTGFYGLVSLLVRTGVTAMDAVQLTSVGHLLAYQTINFHHYVVDGFIWKLRKAKIRRNLGGEA